MNARVVYQTMWLPEERIDERVAELENVIATAMRIVIAATHVSDHVAMAIVGANLVALAKRYSDDDDAVKEAASQQYEEAALRRIGYYEPEEGWHPFPMHAGEEMIDMRSSDWPNNIIKKIECDFDE